MKTRALAFIYTCILFCGCSCEKETVKVEPTIVPIPIVEKERQKYEPEGDQCIFFIGQDMGAIGGIEGYEDGYCNHFEMPAGITVYTGIGTLSGIYEKANWGSGDCFANKQALAQGFENTAIAIGLAMVGDETNVANGTLDSKIEALGAWIKGLNRPVFLRIGYEFDGHDWNHYDREAYLKAWIRIVDHMRADGVNNVAFVWQSKGYGSTQSELTSWYPGDNYVDWCSYSYFSNPDTEMITFARAHNKPVFIAEATPTLQQGSNYLNSDLSDPTVAQTLWDSWFVDFFATMEQNKDIIKAFSYINVDWTSQSMWIDNPTFQQVDSRIQESEYVSTMWKQELAKQKYLHSSDTLFDLLEETIAE